MSFEDSEVISTIHFQTILAEGELKQTEYALVCYKARKTREERRWLKAGLRTRNRLG